MTISEIRTWAFQNLLHDKWELTCEGVKHEEVLTLSQVEQIVKDHPNYRYHIAPQAGSSEFHFREPVELEKSSHVLAAKGPERVILTGIQLKFGTYFNTIGLSVLALSIFSVFAGIIVGIFWFSLALLFSDSAIQQP